MIGTVINSIAIGLIISSAFSAMIVYAQELTPGNVGAVAGLFFGLSFGLGGVGAALLGMLADKTSLTFVYQSAPSCRRSGSWAASCRSAPGKAVRPRPVCDGSLARWSQFAAAERRSKDATVAACEQPPCCATLRSLYENERSFSWA